MEEDFDQLVDSAVRGDRKSLTELLRRVDPYLRSCLAGRISSKCDSKLSVDDVLQQTYADASRKIHQLHKRNEGAFRAWLWTTARRNLITAIRGLDGKVGGWPSEYDPTGCGTSPSAGAEGEDRITALTQALAQIPEDYARVVRMYDLEQRPIEEVAHALGRSHGAVYMLRARAHEKLHELMGNTSKFFTK